MHARTLPLPELDDDDWPPRLRRLLAIIVLAGILAGTLAGWAAYGQALWDRGTYCMAHPAACAAPPIIG